MGDEEKIEEKVSRTSLSLRKQPMQKIYKEEEDIDTFGEEDIIKMEPLDESSDNEEYDENGSQHQESFDENEEASVSDFLEFNINVDHSKGTGENEELLDENTGLRKMKTENGLQIKEEVIDEEQTDVNTKKTFTEGPKSFKYLRANHCHTCQQNFLSESDWKTHMFAHIEARPYECHIVGCDKAFSRKDVLKGHLKSHTKERPFVCTFPGCEKTFTRNWYLKVHYESTHTGQKKEEPPVKKLEKILVCDLCDEVMEKAGDMKAHVLDKHSEFKSGVGLSGYSVKYRNEKGKLNKIP